MADDFTGIFLELQDLVRQVQRCNDQNRQFGNMWELARLLVVNLIDLADQQIRYFPSIGGLDIGLEGIRLPEKLYSDKLVQ
jgi:hypothetical protein